MFNRETFNSDMSITSSRTYTLLIPKRTLCCGMRPNNCKIYTQREGGIANGIKKPSIFTRKGKPRLAYLQLFGQISVNSDLDEIEMERPSIS